eukprot:19720-Chlamydomonas_euryale.AAC.7
MDAGGLELRRFVRISESALMMTCQPDDWPLDAAAAAAADGPAEDSDGGRGRAAARAAAASARLSVALGVLKELLGVAFGAAAGGQLRAAAAHVAGDAAA